jgi:hypothetical protein
MSEQLPTPVFTDMAYLQRIASAAANETAERMKEQTVTRDEVEDIVKEVVKESVNQFLEYTFDIAPGDRKAMADLRKDFAALRSSRELREALIKHGFMAIVGLAMSAVGTALWLAIKGAK